MFKSVLDSKALQEIATTAIKTLAAPVKATLGPHGRPIIIQLQGQNPDGSPITPIITKDGVTVAEHVSLRNPKLNTIVQTVVEVAKKTVNEGGDGTTTSVVLAEAIYEEGLRYAQKGVNNIEIYNKLNILKEEILDKINKIKTPISGEDAVRNIALISSNGDEELSDIVTEAVQSAGEHGYIELEEGTSKETTLEVIEGASYKRGWRNFAPNGSIMINDKSRNVCEFENVAVLLHAGKLSEVHELADYINKVMEFDDRAGHLTNVFPLIIVAYDYSDDVKNFILQQSVQAKLPIAAIKAPRDGSPNHATEMLHDMAAMLGASVTAKGILELKDVGDEVLGGADKISIGAEETTFYDSKGDKEEIKSRLKDLETLLDTGSLDPFDAQNVRIRKAKLSQGIVVVRVGGSTEAEIKEKRDRAEDALCAARVAIKDGIVPGGGITLYNIAEQITGDDIASKILKEALKAPIKQIIENSGKSSEKILTLLDLEKDSNPNIGYDARAEEIADLLERGIIDPAQVTKSALQNAISIAGLLLTTGGALVSDEEPEDGKPNPLAGMF